MKRSDVFWCAFDALLILVLVFIYDLRGYLGYLLFLIYRVLMHGVSIVFDRYLPGHFREAHLIDFRRPDLWIFVVWFIFAIVVDLRN